MKLTLKDMINAIGFLEVAKSTTERALKGAEPTSIYAETMRQQLKKVTDLIERFNNLEL